MAVASACTAAEAGRKQKFCRNKLRRRENYTLYEESVFLLPCLVDQKTVAIDYAEGHLAGLFTPTAFDPFRLINRLRRTSSRVI